MTESGPLPVSLSDIQTAAVRISPFVKLTPVFTSQRLDLLLGAEIYFKCENFQRVGSFKARGAHNAVLSLDEASAARGVVTYSSGNHAVALSLAARNRDIAAYVVMPSNAPRGKVEAVLRLGGKIHFCEPNFRALQTAAASIVAERGAALISANDDLSVIAGHGTAMTEFLAQVPELNVILAPVGSGGLMSGTAIAARGLQRDMRIIGVGPEQADHAFRSWSHGELIDAGPASSIADGLRGPLGSNGLRVMRTLLNEFATVSEDAIIQATRLVWEVLKIIIEPSSAVPVAALLERKINLTERRVGIILSGGNVDMEELPWQLGQQA